MSRSWRDTKTLGWLGGQVSWDHEFHVTGPTDGQSRIAMGISAVMGNKVVMGNDVVMGNLIVMGNPIAGKGFLSR